MQEVVGGNFAIVAVEDTPVRDRPSDADGRCSSRNRRRFRCPVSFALVGRIGEVGKQMRVLRQAEIVVQAGREEMVDAIVFVPPK